MYILFITLQIYFHFCNYSTINVVNFYVLQHIFKGIKD